MVEILDEEPGLVTRKGSNPRVQYKEPKEMSKTWRVNDGPVTQMPLSLFAALFSGMCFSGSRQLRARLTQTLGEGGHFFSAAIDLFSKRAS